MVFIESFLSENIQAVQGEEAYMEATMQTALRHITDMSEKEQMHYLENGYLNEK